MSKYNEEFAAAYRAMAAQGHCDTLGGMESERVYEEWQLAAQPALWEFIRERANAGPRDVKSPIVCAALLAAKADLTFRKTLPVACLCLRLRTVPQ